MTKIHLGINNCFAVKRWPEPDAWAEIVAKELGADVVQFSLDLLDPSLPEPSQSKLVSDVRDACARYGLTIQSTFTGFIGYSSSMLLHPDPTQRMYNLRWWEQAIGLTGRLGGVATGGHVGALSMRDLENVERRHYLISFLIESLQHLAAVGRENGLSYFLWELMPVIREKPTTIDEAKEFLARVNENAPIPIKFCIDLGHQCCYAATGRDADTYAWLRELARESPVIHLQQTDGKGDGHWPFTREFNKLGIIVPEKVIESINASGADEVFLIFEVVHPFEAKESKVIDDLKESLDYWRKVL